MPRSRLFLIAAGALLLGACTTTTPPGNTTGSGNVACTMEAKLCPDGSYVERVPPSCNFAPCPGTSSGSGANSSAPQTVSDGTISFSVPADYALAVAGEQILKPSYIPPCDQGFTYCLYYMGNLYQGTNFESAGLGIVNRTDLTSKQTCLATPPEGYTSITPATKDASTYATSVFAPLGNAAMGHYVDDRVYRLFAKNACYEFHTRIGMSQFDNYPEGTIQKFTTADEAAVQTTLDSILHGITLKNGTSLTFPAAPSSSSSAH